MKRKLLSVLLTLCLAFSLLPTAALADGENVAKVGDTEYATLAEAVAAVADGGTVTLLKSATGGAVGTFKGAKAGQIEAKSFTIDFGGYTYTVTNPAVGSTGYESQAFHLERSANDDENHKVTFKNGTITTAENFGGRMLIQNYCDLTLENMTIIGDSKISYVISNNFGSLTAKGNTVIKAADGKVAFDLWYGMDKNGLYDNGVSVTFGTDFTGSVTGKIEYGAHSRVPSNSNWKDKARLTIANGNFATTFVDSNNNDGVAPEDFNITITGGTFTSDVSAYVPNGYIYNSETKTVEPLGETNAVAKVGDTYYKTLAEAVAAADNATVTLLKNTTEDITIASDKTVTLDLAGHKLTNVSGHTITNNGTLFVTGNGTVDNIAHGKGALYNNTGATATLNGGTFTRSAEKGTASPDSANGNSWYTVKNYGTMTINSNVTITNTGSHSSAVANGWFDVSKVGSNGEPAYTTNAVLTINGGNISGGKITVKNDDYGTLTITGGSISQPLNGLYCIYNANVTAISGGNVNGPVGNYNGVSTEADQGKFSITGGLFSSDPSDYVAAGHYVDASNNGDYPYTVKEGTKPAGALIVVKDKTDTAVSSDITGNDEDAINGVISKANVDGVAEAVAPAKKADIVAKSGATVAENDKVEIEVAVKVEAKAADLANGKLTFEASPVATVKVNGIEQAQKVPVTNDMLNGQPITVKLPLPTVNGSLFTPKQIKHISSDNSIEYFILNTAEEANLRGAKTFKIVDGCAVFTITKFSTFELSGTVTYVEPSYSSGGSSDPTYSVSTPSKTEHGTVTVSPKSASKGDRVTVTVKPDSGYVLETLTVTDKNGNELTLKDKGNGKYTFTMPAGKVEVKATFMEDNSMLNFFYDVPNGAYFYEAVKWAVKNGITTGVGNDLFAPEQPCTRAQIVTFLWRAAGSPEPKGAASGMTDVVSGSYYEKAVAWAIENGITTGTTTSTFSPDATCTRAQAVTFLARALKAKAASAAEFSDVPTGSYFADAVAWAAANGVTEGIGGGLFGSDNDCTRGQIVTFLYRAYNK